MAGRLTGKVAVVTGGGNGIGRACCIRFAEEGADVVVADIQEAAAGETAELVDKVGGRSSAFVLDAADPEANAAMVAQAVEDFGGMDVLVTAAGISHAAYVSGDRSGDAELLERGAEMLTAPHRGLLELELGDWQRVLDVNLTGTFLALQAAGRRMVEQDRGGSIVTIASVAAKVPEAGPPPYTVSKAAVWMLTKSAARVFAPVGIRVNSVGPGFIDTNMTAMVNDLPMIRELAMNQIPMGRMGTPAEVANAVLFLASDEASYVTGELLHPDGGFFTD